MRFSKSDAFRKANSARKRDRELVYLFAPASSHSWPRKWDPVGWNEKRVNTLIWLINFIFLGRVRPRGPTSHFWTGQVAIENGSSSGSSLIAGSTGKQSLI